MGTRPSCGADRVAALAPRTRESRLVALFRSEYERIDRDVYGGTLPPFPGVRLTHRTDELGSTRTRYLRTPSGWTRVLEPFDLSARIGNPRVVLNAIRHEIAHAAAIFLDGEEAHGPRWREHAALCGATTGATEDDDPMFT